MLKTVLYFEIIPERDYGKIDNLPLTVKISPLGVLDISYRGNKIWHETIIGPAAHFNVETLDSISRIIACIDNKDNSWKKLYYYDDTNKS